MTKTTYAILTAGIILIALMIRVHYVSAVQIENPLGGDAREYVIYAQSVLQGYFGQRGVLDAYRSPGYPAFLAAAMAMGKGWPMRLLLWQALLGAATVGFTIALARQWLSRGWSLAPGVLLALWPHHIAFTAEVLSEVLLGFCLTGALLLTILSVERRKLSWGVAAGIAWAAAYLVNPIVALLPFAIAAFVWRSAGARVFIASLVPLLLVAGLWAARSADGGSDRAWINLTQGSYPLYHRALVSRNADPVPARIMDEIDADSALMVKDHKAGIANLSARLLDDPIFYGQWYASKAYLLWDWDIRVSAAFGPYVHVANNSNLERPPLSWSMAVLRFLNPAIFWASMIYALYALLRSPTPARILAISFLYFTAVHIILQAEPRYSIPYRPIELLLFVSSIAWLATYARSRVVTRVPKVGAVGRAECIGE